LRKAIGFFDQAIAREPSYALAYAGLADCYSLLSVYSRISPAESFPRAKAAAQRAIELDESLAEAHTSLAWAYFNFDWNWSAAEREFRRAIALNPNYATAHQWYSLYLSAMGRHDEALAQIRQALELDPLSMVINTGVGTTFYLAGRYDDAKEQFSKTLEMEPGFRRGQFELARLQELRGHCAEAIPVLQQLSAQGGTPYQAALARAYARCGKRDEATSLTAQLIARQKETYVNPYEIAAIYAALGDRDATFQWLYRAHQEHVTRLAYLNVEPMFTDLRTDPRFQQLARSLGLTH
jgi:serine/threonine-protein kinase